MQKLNFSNYFLAEAKSKTVVSTLIRANPYTIAHEGLVNHVHQLSKDLDADHQVILSGSHDNKLNPLSPEQKLRYAKLANPGVNVTTATPEAPTLLHQLSKLHDKGYKNLHLVFGEIGRAHV